MPLSSVLGASSVIKPGVCTSTTRPSVPYTGQLIYETDTAKVASWNGSAWVYTATGALVYLTEGTFSGVASVSMAAGTFTTTYKNYRVLFHATSTSAGQNIGVRVNVSGTAQTSSVYYGGWAAVDNSGTFSGFGSNGNSSAVFTNIASGSQAYAEFTIYDPANAATKTWWSGTMAGANSVGNTAGGAGGNLYNVAAAHDGLTFLVNGTFGGSYYVYGITD